MSSLLNIFKKIKSKKADTPKPSHSAKTSFNERYDCFQKLLSDNNLILETIADMEETLLGDSMVDMNYVNSKCEIVEKRVKNIIDYLNSLSNRKYCDLYEAFEKTDSVIKEALAKDVEIPKTDFTIPFEDATKEMVNSVGGKNANLGEMKNRLSLPVPEGFCITAYAFKRFMDYNDLIHKIDISSVDTGNIEELNMASKKAKDLVLKARIPSDLAESISDAVSELERKIAHRAVFNVSVRSSAIHEDAEFTFAGQYKTVLNVGPDHVIAAYVEVIASLFTSKAIFYNKSKGFQQKDMVMAVGVVEMIGAKASGVMYSRDPTDEERRGIIINGVWGLGKYAVDGKVESATHIVSRDLPGTILEQSRPVQHFMLLCGLEGGVIDVRVPDYIRRRSCLTDDQAKTLAGYALMLEKHYGKPQDIEWALDMKDNIFILQARPLRIIAKKRSRRSPTPLPGHKILIDKGQVACKGVGAGKVYLVGKEEELKDFPEGAVLVGKHTSTKFVTVMNKASAIIADVGSPTGHMASISREYGVPTIVNTEIAMKTLKAGQEITVDATDGKIYEGRVKELVEAEKKDTSFKNTPVFCLLRAVLKKIAPLNLVDPGDEQRFNPQHCETFHDITRFAHEMAMNEMFTISDNSDLGRGKSLKLVVQVPLDIRVIDLGGGVANGSCKITPDNILSIPMKALLKGLTAIQWPGPPPEKRGFLSAITCATVDPKADKLFSETSFAIISKEYMNFSIRLGYHLQTLEAYAGDSINDNYIRFLFKGGGASDDRRVRRTRLIQEILERIDFQVSRTGDVLDGRMTKYDRTTIEKQLGIMAKLTAFTKQLDMTLFNDAIVDWYVREFMKKHCADM